MKLISFESLVKIKQEKEIVTTNENFEVTNVIEELTKEWNKEYGLVFPINNDLFRKCTIDCPTFLANNSYLAIVENKIVGFIITKSWHHSHLLKCYENNGWISLLFVNPPYRNKGIGSELLKRAEDGLKDLGLTEIFVGRDYHNFFPGLPIDLRSNLDWFVKHGYIAEYATTDLINDLSKYTDYLPLKPYKDNKNYIIRLAHKNDFTKIIDFLSLNFPNRWMVEFEDYITNGGNGSEYLICLDNDKVCGYCFVGNPNTLYSQASYGMNWRFRFKRMGAISTLGVDKNYRHLNIAYNLLISAINYLMEIGASDIMIDWTGLVDFYRRFGFEIWKSYTYIKKEETIND